MALYLVPDDFPTITAALAVAGTDDLIDASNSEVSETVFVSSIGAAYTALGITFGFGTNDRLVIDLSAATLNVEGTADGDNGFYSEGDWVISFAHIEHVTITTGSGNDNLTTSPGDDVVDAGGGDDTIQTQSGTATVDGGTGNDRWLGDLSALVVDVNLDLNAALLSQDIGGGNFIENIERINIATGTGADTIVTHSGQFDDSVNTGEGNDTVTIYDGVDSIDLGSGTDDHLIVDWSASTSNTTSFTGGFASGTREVYFLNVDRLTIDTGSGDDTVATGAGNDAINGAGGNDHLSGNEGDDALTGGAGDDTLNGGDGLDVASFSGSRAQYTISYAAGSFTVVDNAGADGTDTLTGIEEVMFFDGLFDLSAGNSAPTNIALSKTSVQEFRANGTVVATLSATDEDAGDTFTYALLNNAGGRFAIVGDQLRVANGLLLDREQASSHAISVRVTDSGGLTFTKNFTIGVSDVNPENIIGNASANTLFGGSLADRFDGASGNDKLLGQGGTDTLLGGIGNDTLTGGTGRDTMTGSSGADDFDFNSITETGKTSTTRDVIKDFTHGSDDIDLSTIDANGSAAGNAAFKFLSVKGAGFTGVKGQLKWSQINVAGTASDKTIIEGDINGDRRADFHIELTGLKTLTSGDFVL